MFSREAARRILSTSKTMIGWKTGAFRGHHDSAKLAARVERVLSAKKASGLSYDELANQIGVTNTYAAQLLLGQAKLTPATAEKLRQVLPEIEEADLVEMRDSFPMRSYDAELLKEPHIYRTYEAVTHYGTAIKGIINEQCGDGIMSAIDFYCDVGVSLLHITSRQPSVVKPSHYLTFYCILVTSDNHWKARRETGGHHLQWKVLAVHRTKGRRQRCEEP